MADFRHARACGIVDCQIRGRGDGGLQRSFGDSSARAGIALSGVRLSLRVVLAALGTGFLRRNANSSVRVKVCDEFMAVGTRAAALGTLVQFDTVGWGVSALIGPR